MHSLGWPSWRCLSASLSPALLPTTARSSASVRPRPRRVARRIHLAFSGGRQGYSWSWIKGRTPNEADLPRRFHSVARLTMRGSTSSTQNNINPHVYVCVGFRDHIVQRMEFDDHEDHDKNWNDTDDCAC